MRSQVLVQDAGQPVKQQLFAQIKFKITFRIRASVFTTVLTSFNPDLVKALPDPWIETVQLLFNGASWPLNLPRYLHHVTLTISLGEKSGKLRRLACALIFLQNSRMLQRFTTTFCDNDCVVPSKVGDLASGVWPRAAHRQDSCDHKAADEAIRTGLDRELRSRRRVKPIWPSLRHSNRD